MSRKPLDDAPLEPTAERVADFLSAHLGPLPPARSGEREFVRRLESSRRAQRRRKRLAVGVTVVGTLAVLGLGGAKLWDRVSTGAALSYRLDDRPPPPGGYVQVSRPAGSLLAFSDGSQVRLGPRTRGRVVELSSRGAKLALDDGSVTVEVVPRPHAQWVFEAGPFRVNVHGTSFTVAWSPVEAVFEVHLATGSISVASPLAGSELKMRAGQSLRVSLRDRTSTLGTAGDRATASPGDAPPAAVPPEPPPVVPSGLPEPARWSHRGWTTALAHDRAAHVVAEAERRGLTTVLERADSDDLWALANAARYVGRYPLARQALVSQRRRFPGSDRARQAAFLLGRLHDGDGDGPEKALEWYDRYLVEAHDGAGVSDVLGRKMTLLARWNRRAEALSVGREYLRRYPRGTYAHAARALVRSVAAGP